MRDTPIVSAPDADLGWLDGVSIAKEKQGRKYKSKRRYIDLVTAFDIETSIYRDGEDVPHGYMYIWQWQLGDKMTVIGRTWDEFLAFYNRVHSHLSEERQLIVYVHNLSYEFQYLSGVLDMTRAEIFATSPRKVLYFKLDNFEFRCSMRLANCSLASWTSQLGVDHAKLSGDEFDYNEVRYPWTQLTDRQLQYCVNDVVGVVECVLVTLKRGNDSLYSIPLTSTGYIRRMVRDAVNGCRISIKAQQNTLEVYRALRSAYRGGDTHANRYEVGSILKTVYSYDRSSSYPDVMMHGKFPVSKFRKEPILTLDSCTRLIKCGRCLLTKVRFEKIRVKPWNTCPYISLSKCDAENYKLDNGRILSADVVETWLTDLDLRLILDEYDMEGMKILDLYSARYGYLPKEIRDVIKKLYKDKTELKGVEGMEERYVMSKQLLNSVYGMMCQRVITPAVVFTGDDWAYDLGYNEEEEYEKQISKAFLNYAWGVWTCAIARVRLHSGIKAAGWDNFVYCDTDSVKSLEDIDLTEFNNARIVDALKSGAYATDPKGNVHYMGVFEREVVYDEFVTLGAKRYAYKIDGELGMTVAGVSKKKGYKELEKLGGLPAFRDGVTFYEAQHICAYYNNEDDFYIDVGGRPLHITRNVALVECPYTLKLGDDLRSLVNNLKFMLDRFECLDYNDIES